jgi:hypothetical protein
MRQSEWRTQVLLFTKVRNKVSKTPTCQTHPGIVSGLRTIVITAGRPRDTEQMPDPAKVQACRLIAFSSNGAAQRGGSAHRAALAIAGMRLATT